jgi:hypothetical protein
VGSLLLLATLAATDLTGVWVGWIERQNNEPLDVAFRFVHRADTLTGKVYDDYKSPPLLDGKVTDDAVSFVVVVAEQAGNEIRQSRYRYTGKLVDGQLEMTRERESSTNAANGGGVQPGRNVTKQTFRLKRLIAKLEKTAR